MGRGFAAAIRAMVGFHHPRYRDNSTIKFSYRLNHQPGTSSGVIMQFSKIQLSRYITTTLLMLTATFFTASAQAACKECGTVTNVRTVKIEGKGSGAGVVAGGLVGGVLGHQVGGGTGKDLATIGGVVGGAYLGNQAEKKSKETLQYRVTVKMENGSNKTFRFSSPTSYKIGDKIIVKSGKLTRP